MQLRRLTILVLFAMIPALVYESTIGDPVVFLTLLNVAIIAAVLYTAFGDAEEPGHATH